MPDNNPISIKLDNGKYEILYNATGHFPEKALRYGEPYRDLIGDNLIFFLCSELIAAREEIAKLKNT